MEYRSLDKIAAQAEVQPLGVTAPRMSRRERLERWADLLADERRCLNAIEEMEFGPLEQRNAKRADDSPLTVAFEDPVLRAEGLRGDRVGDAVEFFGLSHGQLHLMVCYCHQGRTISPLAMAARLRSIARRSDGKARLMSQGGLIAVSAAAALTAALAFF
jgi:hypothetical protein